MNIAFVNGKGGVGKTTCALLFALCLDEVGRSVKCFDTDPQGSLAQSLERLNRSDLLENPDPEFTIIDTPARLQHFAPKAVKAADKIVVVSRPGYGPDLETTVDTINYIEELGRAGDCKLLFNQVKKNTQSEQLLNDLNFDIEIIPHRLYLREEFSRVHWLGLDALKTAAQREVSKIVMSVI